MTKRISRWVSIRLSGRVRELIREPGRSRPGDTGDIALLGAARATFHEASHGARSLHERNPSNSDRSGSSRRASGAARTDTHAGTQAAAASLGSRSREDIHQRRGLERNCAHRRPRHRAPKPEDDVERLDSGTLAPNGLAQESAQQIPVDRAPELFAGDDITHSPMRTSGGERKQLQIFTVDAAAALK